MNLESIFHFCQPLNGSLMDPSEGEYILFVGFAGADEENWLLLSVTLWAAAEIHFLLQAILSLSETKKEVLSQAFSL